MCVLLWFEVVCGNVMGCVVLSYTLLICHCNFSVSILVVAFQRTVIM